ncbi:MAG: hypothetical protein U0Y68_05910 [Blastocatellia bacterium]
MKNAFLRYRGTRATLEKTLNDPQISSNNGTSRGKEYGDGFWDHQNFNGNGVGGQLLPCQLQQDSGQPNHEPRTKYEQKIFLKNGGVHSLV